MDDYLTPQELLKQNPELSNKWTARELGYLAMCKVVKSKKFCNLNFIFVPSALELYENTKNIK